MLLSSDRGVVAMLLSSDHGVVAMLLASDRGVVAMLLSSDHGGVAMLLASDHGVVAMLLAWDHGGVAAGCSGCARGAVVGKPVRAGRRWDFQLGCGAVAQCLPAAGPTHAASAAFCVERQFAIGAYSGDVVIIYFLLLAGFIFS